MNKLLNRFHFFHTFCLSLINFDSSKSTLVIHWKDLADASIKCIKVHCYFDLQAKNHDILGHMGDSLPYVILMNCIKVPFSFGCSVAEKYRQIGRSSEKKLKMTKGIKWHYK